MNLSINVWKDGEEWSYACVGYGLYPHSTMHTVYFSGSANTEKEAKLECLAILERGIQNAMRIIQG